MRALNNGSSGVRLTSRNSNGPRSLRMPSIGVVSISKGFGFGRTASGLGGLTASISCETFSETRNFAIKTRRECLEDSRPAAIRKASNPSPTRRGAARRISSNHNAGDIAVTAFSAILFGEGLNHIRHERSEGFCSFLLVADKLLRCLLTFGRVPSNINLGRIQFQNDPAIVGIPFEVRVGGVAIVKFTRFDLGAVPGGEFPAAPFALASFQSDLFPVKLILRHEPLGEFFGKRAERKTCGHVTDLPTLERIEPVHVRAFPIH